MTTPSCATSGSTKLSSSVTGSLTKTGHVVGTLDYIAPEQIRGEDASPASDVYAFAAVLYETLTGQVPFRRPSEAALLFAHVSDPPPKVSELRPDLPAELDDVIAAGLAKLPSQRPASPLELVEHAEALLAGSRAGVPSLPTHAPLARPTVADTPREPPRAAAAGVRLHGRRRPSRAAAGLDRDRHRRARAAAARP